MFDAIVILALLLTACVVGLILDHRQARRIDRRIDERIATLRVALKLSQDLDNSMNERAAQFRSENHG